jgi:hypothetical protein
MITTTYPNGQTLTSTALTPNAINLVIQPLTCGMIGVNPPDPNIVRVDWQTQGQPFVPTPGVDVCFISCVPYDVEYSRVRDRTTSGAGPVVETWVYTRGWKIQWVLYGPTSTDRARMIHSATFMDYFNSTLEGAALYPLNDPPEPTRIPEEFNAQWFERADFHIIMYEQVTETISYNAVTSIEVKVYADDLGLVADITETNP